MRRPCDKDKGDDKDKKDGKNFNFKKGNLTVSKDPENGKTCLRVKEGRSFGAVTLPALTLSGNYFIEAEFLIQTDSEKNQETQRFWILLASRNGSERVHVDILPFGRVKIESKGEFTPLNWIGNGVNSFKLLRKGDVVSVEINGEHLRRYTFVDLPDFDIVRIGLHGYNVGSDDWARIYSVKVGRLPAQ